MNALLMILLLNLFPFQNNVAVNYENPSLNSFLCDSPMPDGNEIKCLVGTYKSTWQGKTLIVEIVDARYNNFFSFKGIVSGYIKYNGKTYPMTGTLRLSTKENYYGVYMGMNDYDSKNKVCFSFDGKITCYSNGISKFEGAIITPGYSHPEMNEITLIKK